MRLTAFTLRGNGNGGGPWLAKPAASVVSGEVVRDTEGAALRADCFALPGGNCCPAPVCTLAGAMQVAVDAFYLVLDGYTLEVAANVRH